MSGAPVEAGGSAVKIKGKKRSATNLNPKADIFNAVHLVLKVILGVLA